MPLFTVAMLPFTLTAAGAGATAAAGIYGANKQADAAKQAATLTTSSSDKQLEYLKAKDAQDQKNWEAAQAENRRQVDIANRLGLDQYNLGLDQYNAREDRLAPYRGIGSNATLTLNNLIGGAALPTSSPHVPHLTLNSLPTSGSSGAPAASASSGAAAFAKTLLDQGLDPQAAIAQTNDKFGLSPEQKNSGQYYGAEVHGKPAIGFPDAYLTQEPNGWQITTRSGGGAAPRPATAPAAVAAVPFTEDDPAAAAPLTLNSLVPRTAALQAPTAAPYRGVAPQTLAPYALNLNNFFQPPRVAAYA